MNQEEKGRLAEALDYFLNESLQQIVLSKPRGQEGAGKVRLRPVTLKGRTVFQAEEQRGTQAFWKRQRLRTMWKRPWKSSSARRRCSL